MLAYNKNEKYVEWFSLKFKYLIQLHCMYFKARFYVYVITTKIIFSGKNKGKNWCLETSLISLSVFIYLHTVMLICSCSAGDHSKPFLCPLACLSALYRHTNLTELFLQDDDTLAGVVLAVTNP